MSGQVAMLSLLFILSIFVCGVEGKCHNSCSHNGNCTSSSICECFNGFEGNDCSRRTCAKGPALSAIAYDVDKSHELVPCSGKGTCNHETALCECDPSWGGSSCGRLKCSNDCSGHGECMSLRQAALYNDGFTFNRSTTYEQWDADIFHGCRCDPGYTGMDCSQRACGAGIDPRKAVNSDLNQHSSHDYQYETVTLVCTASAGLAGKFKLFFMGKPLAKWMYAATSTARDLADALMATTPSFGLGNSSASGTSGVVHGRRPVMAGTNTQAPAPGLGTTSSPDNPDGQMCVAGATTYTNIHFHKYNHDLPALSVYASIITNGAVHFETTQQLSCDCTYKNCNGTFRVTFDGEISSRMLTYINAEDVVEVVQSMETVKSAGIHNVTFGPYQLNTVSFAGTTAEQTQQLCFPGEKRSFAYKFTAQMGNIPRLGLWAAVGPPTTNTHGLMRIQGYNTQTDNLNFDVVDYETQYFSSNTYDQNSILTLQSNNGRADNRVQCSGVGTCDNDSGECICPHGWGEHPDLGPCALELFNSSSSNGIARCPGVVHQGIEADTGQYPSRQSQRSHPARVFISSNRGGGPIVGSLSSNSRVSVHDYVGDPVPNILETDTSETRRYVSGRALFNLTTSASAGPIVYDAATERLFFVDQNSGAPFIGVASVSPNDTYLWEEATRNDDFLARQQKDVPYKIFAYLAEPVGGMVFDARIAFRRLYWTYTGVVGVGDGRIAYADVDQQESIYPDVHIRYLNDQIGDPFWVQDPKGLAVHPMENRLYWIDTDVHTYHPSTYNVIRSARITGSSDRTTIFIEEKIGNHTSERDKYTDIIIDIYHNNTAVIIDNGSPPAILAIPLDGAAVSSVEDNYAAASSLHVGEQRVVSDAGDVMGSNANLGFLAMDDINNVVMWSSITNQSISYARVEDRDGVLGYYEAFEEGYRRQLVYDGYLTEDIPVGLAMDGGIGHQDFEDGDYLECHGHGRCMGNKGHFRCECFPGFRGDCSTYSCPTGPAWFHEPVVDAVAHDVMLECSNMGICDRTRGVCACRAGFEGSACERMSCRGQTTKHNVCNGNGRCLSMRELSKKRKGIDLDFKADADYGKKLWDRLTWDADMITGCSADEYGYYPGTTHNISNTQQAGTEDYGQHLECPFGLDLREHETYLTNATGVFGNSTLKSVREEQRIYCTANSGSFTLSFRNHTTDLIAYDATPQRVELALEALVSIGQVSVFVMEGSDSPSKMCNNNAATSHYVDVRFDTELSVVPNMVIGTDTTTHGSAKALFLIQKTVGSGTLKECSGKGECDRQNGVCKCWPNWGSSDGFGNRGTRGDCGYTLIN